MTPLASFFSIDSSQLALIFDKKNCARKWTERNMLSRKKKIILTHFFLQCIVVDLMSTMDRLI